MICFPTGELYFRTSPCKWKWNILGCLGSNLKRSGNSCPNWRSWLGAHWSFYRIKMIKRSMLPWWKGSCQLFTYHNYIFRGSNWFKQAGLSCKILGIHVDQTQMRLPEESQDASYRGLRTPPHTPAHAHTSVPRCGTGFEPPPASSHPQGVTTGPEAHPQSVQTELRKN